MANDVSIVVGANETASDVIEGVGDATVRTSRRIISGMGDTEDAFDNTVRGASRFGDAMAAAEGGAGTLADGVDGVGQAVQSVSDVMSYSARRAENLARAENDVAQAAQDAKQAVEDLAQAERDGAQAAIDMEQAGLDQEQAILDQEKAFKEMNKAIKENGANSEEARQARLDYEQASIDLTQAEEDLEQAHRDEAQAGLDAEQAMIDQKSATDELTAAQRELEAQSGVMQQITEWTGMLGGVLGGLVGIIGAVSAAQWAWNIAMTANPIGLVIAGIVLLIGIIVLIATKTTWFQQLWNAIWGKIGDPVKKAWKWVRDATGTFIDWMKKVPGWIKTAFEKVTGFITAPFKAAFNSVAGAWNSTVGGFGFSVPSWVPGVGGNSFSIPNMPRLAVGGDVLKSGLAYIHAGERINPKGAQVQRLPYDAAMSAGAPMEIKVSIEITGGGDSALEAAMMDLLKNNIRVKATIDTGIRDTVKNNGNGSVQTAYGRKGVN